MSEVAPKQPGILMKRPESITSLSPRKIKWSKEASDSFIFSNRMCEEEGKNMSHV